MNALEKLGWRKKEYTSGVIYEHFDKYPITIFRPNLIVSVSLLYPNDLYALAEVIKEMEASK